MTTGRTTVSVQTPPGLGGIAVILLSGPDVGRVLTGTFRPYPSHRDRPGQLQLGHLVSGDRVIDQAIVHDRGEEAEINIHGGSAVARVALEALAQHGAEPVPSPKASTCFGTRHPKWNNPAIGAEMLEALADARSSLVLAAVSRQWSAGVSALAANASVGSRELLRAADGLAAMQRLLNPAEVVIAGPPNSGKSTLANALVGRSVSITHGEPGTTRDWVREPAVLDGVPVWVTDTAGIWNPPNDVDAQAVRRARAQAARADLLVLLAGDTAEDAPDWPETTHTIRVWSKCDLSSPPEPEYLAISPVTDQGMPQLRRAVIAALGLDDFDPEVPRAFTQRQADLLREAAGAIGQGDRPAAARAMKQLVAGDA